MPNHAARNNMVENQLRTNRIGDERVLAAFAAVPRELFLPERFRDAAYADEDVELDRPRFLIEPLALGKLVQSAALEQHSVVLVIGDWTGYVAAIVARLAGRVVVVSAAEGDRSRIKAALAAADAAIDAGQDGAAEIAGIDLEVGDPRSGAPAQAPFDAIIVAGSVEEVPTALLDQLGDDARLVAVVEEGHAGHVTVYRKVGGGIGRTVPFDATVTALPSFAAAPSFQF